MDWLKAPGLQTRIYGWAKDRYAQVAHCHKRGEGTKWGLCGHRFANVIEWPHERDAVCSVCETRVLAIEREMNREEPTLIIRGK